MLNQFTSSECEEGAHHVSLLVLLISALNCVPLEQMKASAEHKILSISSVKQEEKTNHFREESSASVKVMETTP